MFQRHNQGMGVVAVGIVSLAGWGAGATSVYGQVYADQLEESAMHEEFSLEDPVPESPNQGKLSFNAGIDFTNAYFFRGLLNEDQDLIAQPWAELTLTLCDCEGPISDLALTGGIWNSLHEEKTGAQRDTTDIEFWYELDLYLTLSATLFESWGVDFTYTAYTSPSDAFSTIHEISFGVGYDDSAHWESLDLGIAGFGGLQPSARIAIEVERSVVGRDEGVYLELAIEPSFTSAIEFGGNPVTVSIPMTLGFSLDDYYEDPSGDDEQFGYFDIGLIGSWPMGFVPSDYGQWLLSGGVHFLFLGDTPESINNNDNFEFIGVISISMSY